jgi:hypothetical protein
MREIGLQMMSAAPDHRLLNLTGHHSEIRNETGVAPVAPVGLTADAAEVAAQVVIATVIVETLIVSLKSEAAPNLEVEMQTL